MATYLTDMQGKRYWSFGDSRIYGYLASPFDSKRRTALICAARNGLDYNVGVPGQTLENQGGNFFKLDNLNQVAANGGLAQLAYVELGWGSNDIRSATCTAAGYKTTLLACIDRLLSLGVTAQQILVSNVGYFTDYQNGSLAKHLQYNQVCLEAKQERNTLFLNNYQALASRNDRDQLLGDNLHENNAGYQVEADAQLAADLAFSGANQASAGLRLPWRLASATIPAIGVDADPFLLTWNTGTRQTGLIPYLASDGYIENNTHDSQGVAALLDGTTSAYYGDALKLADVPPVLRLDVRRYKPTLSSLRVFSRNTYGPISYSYIPKGSFTPVSLGSVASNAGWVTLPLPAPTDVSWVLITSTNTADFPSEVQLNGSYVAPTAVTPTVRKPKLKNMLWANVFNWNVLENDGRSFTMAQRVALLQMYGGVRHYLDRVHLEGRVKGDYYFAPSYNGAGSWNLDDFYQALHDAGIDVRACIKNSPQWLQNTWPSELRSSEQLPVEYDTDRTTTTAKAYLPASYLAEGKLFFQFAARYGSAVVASNLLRVHTEANGAFPNNTARTGLGLVSKLEVSNEPDSWWHGWSGYQTGRMIAARLSCVYDGHKSTMGAGVGVKNADPAMSVSFPGLAVATTETYRAAVDWCRENRGYKTDGSVNLCWDVANYHQYANDGGSAQYGTKTRGTMPENLLPKMQEFVRYSDEQLQGMGVILGEFGWDISQFGKQRAARASDIGNETADKTTRKLVQAQWLLRTALLGWVTGLSELQMYLLDDVSTSEYDDYAQSGMNDSATLTRRPSGNFYYQAKQLLGEYQVDAVLSTAPYVVRAVSGATTTYVLWSPTETNASTTYVLNLPSGGTLYTLSLDSTTPSQKPLAAGNNTIPVSETPCFVLSSVAAVGTDTRTAIDPATGPPAGLTYSPGITLLSEMADPDGVIRVNKKIIAGQIKLNCGSTPVEITQCIVLHGPNEAGITTGESPHLTLVDVGVYGNTTTMDGTARQRNVVINKPVYLDMHHCTVETGGGIYVDHWNGTSTALCRVKNIRVSNVIGTSQEFRHAIQISNVHTSGLEVGFFEVYNQPDLSRTEDTINLYNSGGTAVGSKLMGRGFGLFGAYPYPATDSLFTGAQLSADGSGNNGETQSQFIELSDIFQTSACGAHGNIATGNNISYKNVYGVTCGYLPDGRRLRATYRAYWIGDFYGLGAGANNTISGIKVHYERTKDLDNDPSPIRRADFVADPNVSSDVPNPGIDVANAVLLPRTPTLAEGLAQEKAVFLAWVKYLNDNSETCGSRFIPSQLAS